MVLDIIVIKTNMDYFLFHRRLHFSFWFSGTAYHFEVLIIDNIPRLQQWGASTLSLLRSVQILIGSDAKHFWLVSEYFFRDVQGVIGDMFDETETFGDDIIVNLIIIYLHE